MIRDQATIDRLMRQSVIDDRGYHLPGSIAPSPCRIWAGGKSSNHYGIASHEGRRVRVHRLAFQSHGGRILAGFIVHHRCHHRLCWEPTHLQAIPRAVNASLKMHNKLTARDALLIRSSPEPVERLAALYRVTPHHIKQIQASARWANADLCHFFDTSGSGKCVAA